MTAPILVRKCQEKCVEFTSLIILKRRFRNFILKDLWKYNYIVGKKLGRVAEWSALQTGNRVTRVRFQSKSKLFSSQTKYFFGTKFKIKINLTFFFN